MSHTFFTDLDGTLLDFDTYSFKLSLEGIDLLKKNGIHLIPVSSKTCDEMTELMLKIGLTSPFAFENGAGIAVPGDRGYSIELYGPGIDIINSAVRGLEPFAGGSITLLSEMDPEDAAELTGLSYTGAELAQKRRASAPFLIDRNSILSEKEIRRINGELDAHGLELTMGGRFYHVIPRGLGKGWAVGEILRTLKVGDSGNYVSAGAGDGINDLPMLRAVDYPFLVRRPGGCHVTAPPGVHLTDGAGPAGFSEAVKIFLNIIQD